eukprot:CAMPEP_0168332812 /NCGR_PEP_ID=MMETSP0213-20121227/9201_1 /TAXON_ID=151035 /ORGANISM="Euplotes harpa, Strain FSP1.4" /LENGTH=101 /DNA_ID=CAMNT_0008336949 /DNA_START=242 /DNA_END=548 /DNA_ORIENTATION=+
MLNSCEITNQRAVEASPSLRKLNMQPPSSARPFCAALAREPILQRGHSVAPQAPRQRARQNVRAVVLDQPQDPAASAEPGDVRVQKPPAAFNLAEHGERFV